MSAIRLDQFIIDKLGLERNTEAFNAVYAASVRYCCSGYKSIKDYHNAMQEHVNFAELDFTAADFRMQVTAHIRFMLNLKYFVLRVLLSKNKQKAVQKYEEYGISRTEAVLAWNLLLTHETVRQDILSSIAVKHKDIDRSTVSPKRMLAKIKDFNAHSEALRKYVKYSVYKKLRWVMQAHNIQALDLECDVLCQVLSVYYQSLPNKREPLHELNYLKATVTSRIDNMNNKFGAKKRERMVKSGDSYHIVVMSENQLGKMHSDPDGTMPNYDELGSSDHISDDVLERKVTISRLLDVPVRTKAWALRNTVLGRHTVAFTAFLRQRNMVREGETSIDFLMKRSFKQIVNQLAEWLSVSKKSVEASLSQLRTAL